jgi:sialate O-acetylesterase
LYNGMIAPIGRYGFRGVVWYQGESNTGEAAAYGSHLDSLIADWRQRFGDELPWLNVQLAGYGVPSTAPSESGWAALREVQRRHREHDARYGIASAVDIGDRYDIHPPNKQELGSRLSRLARHLVYGERELAPTGPQPQSAHREGDEIVLRFANVSEGLVAYGAEHPIGFELCTNVPGEPPARDASSASVGARWQPTARDCHYADATLAGNTVQLRHANPVVIRAATHVRHGWADNPVITLFDRVGLPVQPFDQPIAVANQP